MDTPFAPQKTAQPLYKTDVAEVEKEIPTGEGISYGIGAFAEMCFQEKS
jgi:hypothetical protein